MDGSCKVSTRERGENCWEQSRIQLADVTDGDS